MATSTASQVVPCVRSRSRSRTKRIGAGGMNVSTSGVTGTLFDEGGEESSHDHAGREGAGLPVSAVARRQAVPAQVVRAERQRRTQGSARDRRRRVEFGEEPATGVDVGDAACLQGDRRDGEQAPAPMRKSRRARGTRRRPAPRRATPAPKGASGPCSRRSTARGFAPWDVAPRMHRHRRSWRALHRSEPTSARSRRRGVANFDRRFAKPLNSPRPGTSTSR